MDTNTAPEPNYTITYGDRSVDIRELPHTSLMALVNRGKTHYFGSEQASKVSGWADGVAEETGAVPDDAARAAKKAEFVAAAWEALLGGTVGVSQARGPRGTPIDSIIKTLAVKEIAAILKSQGLAMPTGDKVVQFANGEAFTRAQLVERRLAKHGDRLRKEAEAEIKARERLAAKAAKEAGDEATAETLGL